MVSLLMSGRLLFSMKSSSFALILKMQAGKVQSGTKTRLHVQQHDRSARPEATQPQHALLLVVCPRRTTTPDLGEKFGDRSLCMRWEAGDRLRPPGRQTAILTW
jgi:hypothetical protein